MANEGLFFGNLIQGFLVGQNAARARKAQDEEVKLKTKLYELQLRKLEEQSALEQQQMQQAKQKNLQRTELLNDAMLGVGTGRYPSLTDALADSQAQFDMLRYGFKPEEFGIQPPSSEMQEFEYAKKNPAFASYQFGKRAAGATSINTGGDTRFGRVPEGSMLVLDPATGQPSIRPVPGSPAELEQAGKVSQIDLGFANSTAALDRMIGAAEAIKRDPNLWMGVGFGGSSAAIPGSPGADVAANIESLSSQVAFSVLQAMRDASKTGGALGAVSERELALLESNLAALSRVQSPDQYRKNLQALIDYGRDAQKRLRAAYDQQRSTGLGARPPALGQPAGGPVVIDFEQLPP